jgi:structure-specific endonuclease subunit SLX1
MSFVYLLLSTDNSTYVGATIDVNRRLRQHNKEIKGGAHATGSKVAQGHSWDRICYVSGFPDWPAALQFEWRWKQISRKFPLKMDPLERRFLALKQLLSLEKSTTKAIPFSDWPSPPVINWEDQNNSTYYDTLA